MNAKIVEANKRDYPEILALQHLAFEDEASLLNNWQIPPLTQTLEEMEQECHRAVVLKLVTEEGRIIGSVRAKAEEWTVEVGKLMVHPDYRGRGYGRQLLRYPTLTMAEYEEQALGVIRNTFPEADRTCFPGVYSLGYFNSVDRPSFIYGMLYRGKIRA